jgi:hypothetical protein
LRRQRSLEGLLAAPSLRSYLKHSETNSLLLRWMSANGGHEVTFRLKFCSAVEDYTLLTSRALVATRGAAIYEKFLSEVAPFTMPIPAVVIEDIRTKVDGDIFPINLFWDAYDATLQSLENYFVEFLASSEFKVLQFEASAVAKRIRIFTVLSGSDVCDAEEILKGNGEVQGGIDKLAALTVGLEGADDVDSDDEG